mmetsp:Transcript_19762/g.38702  ORF Transcript_19762/g.38702 Transcript_19762/m.38702 type:complete len:360 (-) Transcript_19762:1389-2468(-)|eukprot:CAMPEP_0171485002 /NCGR_PEP_ID=MMETSP0958-20121227/311_1 /TAXON_ID=87120 /ORGANISM="Aurantiochytrium limacinum, Strain ATCCMYA-1381" /LENGTH=359 /DNA_ID=CAMNT_0012017759 /DNA_START=45 /DNA_END=1124 /DNA_ORIENTATION=-
MDVEKRPGRGRCAVANKVLRRGDLVLSDPGVVPPVLTLDRWDTNCWACLKPSSEASLLRCSRCKVARFCSKGCQRTAWPTHKHECNPTLATVSKLNEYVAPNVVLVARLLGKPECHAQILDLEKSTDTSPNSLIATLATTLANAQDKTDLAFELSSRFDRNNFGIVDSLYVTVALGVYPVGAMLNHSCAPNCVLFYRQEAGRSIQEIRCIAEKIEPGTELVHAYCDAVLPTPERQEKLKDLYNFKCECELCHLPAAEESERANLAPLVSIEGEKLSLALEAGQLEEATVSCQTLIGMYEKVYDRCPYHPLIGLQLYTLGDLLTAQGQPAEKSYARARAILGATYGWESDLVKQLTIGAH